MTAVDYPIEFLFHDNDLDDDILDLDSNFRIQILFSKFGTDRALLFEVSVFKFSSTIPNRDVDVFYIFVILFFTLKNLKHELLLLFECTKSISLETELFVCDSNYALMYLPVPNYRHIVKNYLTHRIELSIPKHFFISFNFSLSLEYYF